MNPATLRALRQLARSYQIQLAYRDASGHEQHASPETLMGVLRALGVEVGDDASIVAARERAQVGDWQETLPPVVVTWDGKPGSVTVRAPADARLAQSFALRLEDGTVRLCKPPARPRVLKRARIERTDYVQWQLPLAALPSGYHELEVTCGKQRRSCLILSAPSKTFSNPELSRSWGVFLPVYAAHSRASWGAGDFADWRTLCQWIGGMGGNVAGTLPLLAAFLDRPLCEPSPYSPASRLFWNEFYIRLEEVPEFASCQQARKLVNSAAFRRELTRLRRATQIDYAAQWALRRRVLEQLARHFFTRSTERQSRFRQFLRQRPELERYARFRAACDELRASWHTWPDRLRNGNLHRADYSPDTERFYAYAQFIAQEQVDAVLATCLRAGVKPYLDLPLGVHPDGYDVWRHREVFTLEASAGAPPDPFFSKGQNWGFAPLQPHRIRQERYQYVLDYLRFQMRHTGLLRIDHVMGLHRLYWIPKGLAATEGAYVSYPAEELYAVLSLESHRHKTTLIGENLGTVPPEVNRSMDRHDLRKMFVLQFEQRPHPKQALATPPKKVVASVNTHDMPTFAAHWNGSDIDDRDALGLVPRGMLSKERQVRRKLNAALVRYLQREGWLNHKRGTTLGALEGCLKYLAASPAEVLLITLEDLWAEPQPQNVPGTYRERPNWRRKAQCSLEQIETDPEIAEILAAIGALRGQE